MEKEIIPFNTWSKQRIREGRKTCTSRHKRYPKDPRVLLITPKLPWGIIKELYWEQEGADSPQELQNVIEEIYKRKILDSEEFYVHIGDFK